MAVKREHFSSELSAVLAMAGSAIGLGNIWRFPYLTGQNGGAAFIIIYILCVVFLALPIFYAESVIGRSSQSSTFGAVDRICPGKWTKIIAMVTVVTPLIILSYYSVVGGWSVGYLFSSVSGGFKDDVSSFFGSFVSSPVLALACHSVFLLLTAFIVVAGVRSGIEKFNKISIPVLFVLILAITVYSVSLPGSGEGVRYLVRPDFSLVGPGTFIDAMGQAFFSLSLGVGTVLVYSSYMRNNASIRNTGVKTAFFDLMFAVLAGFAIMSSVFAAGIEPGSGPGLIFETLPYIFVKMGEDLPVVSYFVSIAFFLTILVAALTSSIAMYEVGIAYLVEQKKHTRKKAVCVIFAGTWALGALCALSFGPLKDVRLLGLDIFSFCDSLTSNFLMVLGALFFVYIAGWRMDKAAVRKELGIAYYFMKYAAPLLILVIFVSGLLG